MSIQSIRNPILRRTVLVVVLPALLILLGAFGAVIGVFYGLYEVLQETPGMIAGAWNGPTRTKAGLRLW
jgi:hypothetical protein